MARSPRGWSTTAVVSIFSGLDLLVDLSPEQSLLGLIGLRQELEDLLGCPVDVSEPALLGCQPDSRIARSSGTRKTSRLPSLPAVSSPRVASFCKSLRAV
ncbi:MAG: hypothetical protein RLZZ117_1644 [Cyanobacteriota bacterium]